MEIELKYALPNKETADAIWNDERIAKIADISTEEKLVMKAVYFDTQDMSLSKNNVSLRVRVEADRSYASLKWGGTAADGFHEREEVTVPVCEDASFIAPRADMFSESPDGQDLLSLIGEKELMNLLETRFLRRRIRLTYKASIIELAIDTGEIVTDGGSGDILELELELFAGSAAELKELGEKLSRRFELRPENRSKFARGLKILEDAGLIEKIFLP